MSECSGCVYHAPDISAEQLHDIKCGYCGRDLRDHPIEERVHITSGMAYVVNPETIRSEWIGAAA